MKCETCGNPAGPCEADRNTLVWGFTIQLRSKFDIYSNVPCFMRTVVNIVLGNFMRVKTPENEFYQFELDKRQYKTRIFGDHYNQFLEDYNMEPSDIVVFEFEPEKDYLNMYPQDQDGTPKEKDAQAVFVFDETAKAVVISKGVKPKPSEVASINDAVLVRGLGQGAVFIHRLTETDIYHNGLRIPKLLVPVIDVPRSGIAYLAFGHVPEMTEASYGLTTDGRIRFKDGWAEFVQDHGLDADMLVLIMFHKMNHDNLQHEYSSEDCEAHTEKEESCNHFDHLSVRGNNIHYYILPDSLNLETLLVEETPRVKPKKPTAGKPMWRGRGRGRGHGRGRGR